MPSTQSEARLTTCGQQQPLKVIGNALRLHMALSVRLSPVKSYLNLLDSRVPVLLPLRRRPCLAMMLSVLRRTRGVLPGVQSPGMWNGWAL